MAIVFEGKREKENERIRTFVARNRGEGSAGRSICNSLLKKIKIKLLSLLLIHVYKSNTTLQLQDHLDGLDEDYETRRSIFAYPEFFFPPRISSLSRIFGTGRRRVIRVNGG